ncbi:MAG: T9SS type A sorting domain-containing protein [Prolixibacteraceae bacterium]|nr:T9SS type A sorting domain-containing protein [Prolixibacteraceae bacterium]
MRKSFTQLFGFLLLSVMMLFSSGLYAQETQSTVELFASPVDQCYNKTNSYTSMISVKDFINMKSFKLTLNFDKSEFEFDAVANASALLLSGVTATVIPDPVLGIVQFTWSNTTAVTIGNNIPGGVKLFDAKFKVVNFPNNTGDNLFDSPLTWDVVNSTYYYVSDFGVGGSYQVETTRFNHSTMNVPVSYTAENFSYTVVPASCDGGKATITITSPTAVGMKYYFNGSTTASTTGIADAFAPSVNTVRIEDASGCYSHLFTIPVTAPSPLTVNSVTTENPLCFGGQGEIQFGISGGTAPYTYWVVPAANWPTVNGDLETKELNNIAFAPYKFSNFQVLKPAGTYYVAVNDANGCVSLRTDAVWQQVTIEAVTAQITYTATAVNNTCNGYTDGSITVSGVAGGTGTDYTVSIDGIHWFALEEGSYTFDELAAKTYTVSVKDINGCTITKDVIITSPAAIVFAPTYTDATCAGGATGSVTVNTPTGGTGPYEFVVAVSGTEMPTTGWVTAPGTKGNLVAAYYSVWVRDANGCVKPYSNPDGSGNILPIQTPGALTFTTNADNVEAVEVACFNGDFTLTAQGAGGVAPYTYSFNGGAYTATNTLLLTPLTVDTDVVVAVMDANGCVLTKTVTVNVPAALDIYSFADPLAPTCSGGTDGRITVNAVGGVAPYMYSTNNATWFANNVLALPEGATTVYVKDAKGCITSDIVTIDFLTPSAFTAAAGLIECYGNTSTKGITITGLTWEEDRTIQYFVSNSATTVFTTGSVFVPESINGVPAPDDNNAATELNFRTFGAGTYYIGARDEYGCTSTIKTVVFTQNPALELTSVVTTNATCSGEFDGTITINTLGGNGTPYYAIVNNAIAISNLTAGDFQPVEDYNITAAPASLRIGKQVIQALRGTYYVVLRDVCVTDNSIFAGPFIVDGYKPIAVNEETNPVVKTNITCNNANDGTITVTGVTGGKPEFDGTGLYTYKLYKDDVLVVTTTPNTTGVFTGLVAGSYYVTVTDATNCPLYKTSTVTVVNPAVLTITNVAVTHFTCVSSNDGVVSVTAAGGTGAYWMAVNASVNGLGTDIKASDWFAFSAGSSTKPYVATEPGVYTFFVKDVNGCLATPVTVTVLAPKVITPVVAVNTPVSCVSGIDGEVDINATGGFETTTPAFTHTYLYSLKSDFTAPVNTTGIFSGLTAGTYTVYVKATNTPAYANGGIVSYTYPTVACTYQLTFVVAGPAEYAYRGEVTKRVSCRGGNDGEFKVTVISGGTPFVNTLTGEEYDVQLTTTANPILLETPGAWKRTTGKVAIFSNLPHAIYSVWIRDAEGCLLPTGAEVVPNPVPVDYVWHKVASWEVQQPGTFLTASVAFNNDVTCFGGNDGKFTITAVGGVGPYKYAVKKSILPAHVLAPDPNSTEWVTTNVFDQATAATWIIWVMDANGCIVGGEGTIANPIDEWRVQIREPQTVKFNDPTSTEVLCFGGATGKVMVSGIISDAGAPYTFNISGTDAAGNAVNLPYSGLTPVDGVYTLTGVPASETKHAAIVDHTHPTFTVKVTDKNGCSTTKTVVVWQNPALTVNLVKADGAFLCPGDVNGVIEAVATGGTNWDGSAPTSYLYQLTKNGVVHTAWQPIPSFIVQVGSSWKIEVKDGNGCIASDEEILNEPVGVTATLHETTCYGDATASVIVKATGEAGRTFSIRYRRNTAVDFGPWVAFTNEIAINNLIFANSIEEQNFYYFEVKDDKGCNTNFYKSFVSTQHPLEVVVTQAEDQLSASMTITGGISPYTYVVGDASVKLPIDGNEFQVVELHAPATVVTVYDAHGCMVAKSLEVAPLTVTAVPASGNNQDNEFDVVLTFNRTVTVAAEDITGGTFTPGTGTSFTVTLTGEDLAELSIVVANTIKDAANNALETTTFTYKVGDHVAPTVVVTPPATPVEAVFTVGLKFSEPVSGVLGGVTVTGGTLTDVSGLGDEYTLTVSGLEQTLVTIVLTDGIKDTSPNANVFAGQTLTYTIGDFTAPQLVTWTPLNETTTDNHPTFKMTFNEDVAVGEGGKLTVYKVLTTTPVLEIPITAAMISGKDVTVTYAPTQNGLDKNTNYYVKVDGLAIQDVAGNKFAGVSDGSAWTFKTGDHFLTSIDPSVNVSLFKVYPNPFVDFVNIDASSKLSKVVVTNIAGQVVKQVVNPANRIQLNELRSGIYFISLHTSDNVIAKTVKIVKR